MRLLSRSLIVLAAMLPLACSAADAPYQEGQHYRQTRTAVAPPDPSKVEVAEVFWYGCPHCYTLDPHLERWKKNKPGFIEFVRLPTSLGREQALMHSRAYYTAEQLGVLDRMHPAIFEAMHEQRQPLVTEAEIGALFQRNGVSAEDYRRTFGGFAVDSRVRRAESLVREYGINSVPAIVVGGRYWTSVGMAGGYDQVFKVVEFMAEKVRAERK